MINPIHNIDNIYVSSEGEPVDLQGVTLSEETLLAYEDALDPDLPLGRRIRRFLTAQNGAGRWAKVIKDAFLIFVPYGRQINTITDFISDRLQPQQTSHNMTWLKNRLKEKSTWRGIATVLTVLGVSLSPEQTAAIVTAGVAFVGLFEVFFKEPDSDD